MSKLINYKSKEGQLLKQVNVFLKQIMDRTGSRCNVDWMQSLPSAGHGCACPGASAAPSAARPGRSGRQQAQRPPGGPRRYEYISQGNRIFYYSPVLLRF